MISQKVTLQENAHGTGSVQVLGGWTRAKPAGAAPSPAACAPRVARGLQQLETLTPVNVHIRGLATHSTHAHQPVSLLLVDYDTTDCRLICAIC
ncbi:hypothetical protein PO909_005584 [Leuciscus waleckii]